MRKNGCVTVGNTQMYYVSFGSGRKKLVVLPGLSDGLTTVKGKAWILSSPYQKFFRDYTVYLFSRKNKMPDGYTIRDMANDQILAMKNIGIEQAYLLGVSQGGHDCSIHGHRQSGEGGQADPCGYGSERK